MDRADFAVTAGESRSTPIHKGGWVYHHDDEQDRADFADFSAGELLKLEAEGFDFSEHPAWGGSSPISTTDQKGTIMLTTVTTTPTTIPGHSGPMTTVELSPVFAHALSACGVDLDSVEVRPDGQIVIVTESGRIAVGQDGDWLSANAINSISEQMIYEGTSITELAAAVARWC